MNLEENSVIASDALIDNFPCLKSFLIFDRGCQSSGIRFLPLSSLLEEVWTLKYLNSGSADWSRIGLGILSVAGPVHGISSGPSVTQNHLFLYMILSKIRHKAPLTWHAFHWIPRFYGYTLIHVLWKVFTIKKERVFCTFWNTCVNVIRQNRSTTDPVVLYFMSSIALEFF